ncbi:MAG TPA: hypothetical protein VFJ75_07105 [Gaiellaceae bacterium]|nr:hypothetical protein [Gaiellaceae bacterium]
MDHRLAIGVVVALGVGQWMVVAGMAKRTLVWRRSPRRCPSCGRARSDCRCVS